MDAMSNRVKSDYREKDKNVKSCLKSPTDDDDDDGDEINRKTNK